MAETRILTPEKIEQMIERMAWQIYESHLNEEKLFLAGIDKKGYTLAKKIDAMLQKISNLDTQLIKVTVNKRAPLSEDVKLSHPISSMENQCVVVIDDVLKSGKTLIYGVRPFLDVTLKNLTTAVLVDRNHKRFPIKADFKGISLSTSLHENVEVDLTQKGGAFLH